MKDGEMTPDDGKIEKLVDVALQQLGEHCESVRIFVTYRSEGALNTTAFSKGSGNGYAQKGQIRDWITEETEKTKIQEWDEAYKDGDDEEGA